MFRAWREYRSRVRRRRRERVLGALALAAWRGDPEMSGWPLMDATGLPSGLVYVVLAELERTGEVTSRWAEGTASPRRRFYQLADKP